MSSNTWTRIVYILRKLLDSVPRCYKWMKANELRAVREDRRENKDIYLGVSCTNGGSMVHNAAH